RPSLISSSNYTDPAPTNKNPAAPRPTLRGRRERLGRRLRRIDAHSRAHRRGNRDAANVISLGAGRLGANDRAEDRAHVVEQLRLAETQLAHARVHDAGLVHAVVHLAGLDLGDRLGDVEGDGANLGIGHQAAGPKDFADTSDLAHHVRGRDDAVEVEPVLFLDLLYDLVAADEVRTRLARLALLLALGDHQHARNRTGPMRKHDSAAHVLVGLARIDAEPHCYLDRLVELGDLVSDDQLDRFFERVALFAIDLLGRFLVFLACHLL